MLHPSYSSRATTADGLSAVRCLADRPSSWHWRSPAALRARPARAGRCSVAAAPRRRPARRPLPGGRAAAHRHRRPRPRSRARAHERHGQAYRRRTGRRVRRRCGAAPEVRRDAQDRRGEDVRRSGPADHDGQARGARRLHQHLRSPEGHRDCREARRARDGREAAGGVDRARQGDRRPPPRAARSTCWSTTRRPGTAATARSGG